MEHSLMAGHLMLRYLFIRLLHAPVVLFLIITLTFFLMRAAPGGPFSSERRLDPEIEKALNIKYNLDKPVFAQYVSYLSDLAHGDLGPSFKHKNISVNEIISTALPQSLFLGILAFILALGLGIPSGIVSALNHNKFWDYGIMSLTVIGISLPTFIIGPLLQLLFAIYWRLVPIAGYEGFTAPSYMILPALTLSLPFAARIARLTRTGMLDTLNQDFIVTARAKGLREYEIVIRHALRGGILPVVSYLGPAFSQIVTGSLVVEKIFQIPGLGREFVEGALNRDYTLVMGTVIVYGLFIIMFNMVADVLYGVLDPRVRYG